MSDVCVISSIYIPHSVSTVLVLIGLTTTSKRFGNYRLQERYRVCLERKQI